LDRFDLIGSGKHRLFHSEEGVYESVVSVTTSAEDIRLLTRRETATDPPAYYLLDPEGDYRRQLISLADRAPELKGISKRIVAFWREDGIELFGTLYLPREYDTRSAVPLLIWVYPRGYRDPRLASQRRDSLHRFGCLIGPSHLLLATQGYAVLELPAMPIVGNKGNDTFVEQLVMNAKAAIDKVVDLGIADRERIAIGGHGHGAFAAVNLLAHSDFFAAGIARSGVYNRTLTPFGFQNEDRTLWEAPETYFAVSPSMHADRVDEPLLLIHGESDNNEGTPAMQSRRLFHAVRGLGGAVRLVMLPHESHVYLARESVMHTLAEMLDWMDQHLGRPQSADQ
jgi:dipeptidyl aminopeptidase/acylaminoacyl peptidase